MTKSNEDIFWEAYTPLIEITEKALKIELKEQAENICRKIIAKFIKENPEIKKGLKKIGTPVDELQEYILRSSRAPLSKAFGMGLDE